jgi:hypothetical protein
MPRLLSATLLALVGGVLAVAPAQDLPSATLGIGVPNPADRAPRQRSALELGEEALAAGLSATAEELFNQALAQPALGAEQRGRLALGLCAALLERTRPAEAKAALAAAPAGPARRLREGLIALLEDRIGEAAAIANTLDPAALPPEEVAWGYALRWMIAAANGDNLAINLNLEAAARTATSEEQRQRIEILGYRALVSAGKVEERTVGLLREMTANAKGSPLAFAYARNLAVGLARLHEWPVLAAGAPETEAYRKEKERIRAARREAVRALADCGPLSDARRAEADLLAGLILGTDAAEGRGLLMAAARNGANPAVRLTALRGLVAAAFEAPLSERKSVANEVYDFLMKRQGEFAYACPRDPKVLDAIHLARAQVMTLAGSREKARQAAEDLLRDVPASPLAREAHRTLALAYWGEGSYRLAADTLGRLRELTPAPAERDALAILAADCLFLAGDLVLAEKAYAAAQAEVRDARLAGDACYQRVLSVLGQGKEAALRERAAGIIEAAARGPRPPELAVTWRNTWNVIDDARQSLRPEEADRLVTRLAPFIASAGDDPGFGLRFAWLKALVALGNGQTAAAVRLADEIAGRLDRLDASADQATNRELRNQVPELRGHLALLRARTFLGQDATKGREELRKLRASQPDSPAAAASFLAEGRFLAGREEHAEAQALFTRLGKDFAGKPGLAEFAALGLYEAAEQAVQQSSAEGEAKLKEAVELLELFAEQHGRNPLIVRVTLRRAELLRALGLFDNSYKILDDLIRAHADDPARPQAEMARADSLLGRSELNRDRMGQLDRQRIGLAVAAYQRVCDAYAKDPDTAAEARYKLALALLERAGTETGIDAAATLREARAHLVGLLAPLRASPAGAPEFTRGGRAWLARAILLLGQVWEKEGNVAEARAAYQLIPELNRGLKPGEARLPGQSAAESKLATLRGPK